MPDQGNAQGGKGEPYGGAYQGTDTGINQAGKEQISPPTNRAEYEGSGRVKRALERDAGDGGPRDLNTISDAVLSRKKPQKTGSRIINHGFKPLPGQGAPDPPAPEQSPP